MNNESTMLTMFLTYTNKSIVSIPLLGENYISGLLLNNQKYFVKINAGLNVVSIFLSSAVRSKNIKCILKLLETGIITICPLVQI